MKGYGGSVNCVSVLPYGRIVSGSSDGTLHVWDLVSGKCTMILKGHNGYINGVLVLPDGRIVSGSGDNTLRVWDADRGR